MNDISVSTTTQRNGSYKKNFTFFKIISLSGWNFCVVMYFILGLPAISFCIILQVPPLFEINQKNSDVLDNDFEMILICLMLWWC
jgi:hypothetical protein